MIEVRNLTKTFSRVRALDDLSMTVPDGAVYGLVGPNGAGKSTLIRHVTGIFRPDAGTVTVDGQPVYENPAVKSRIAYIPDDVFYFPSASIAEMRRFYEGIYPDFSDERYQRLLEAFGLNERVQLRRFSKGMQKQAAFLLAIALCPKILILDEPVDGLDPVMRRQMWSVLMQDVAERGTTVLLSSHNLRELEDVCDHVGILHQGKLLLERPLAELQGSVVKAQLVLREGDTVPESLPVLHQSAVGRVQTLILRCSQAEAETALHALEPVFYDLIPLTLEEVFIYELGGEGYAVRDILV
ncbi:MAG: ABC transporter ATP-binding protein [Ruminococcaceae bacterium]|nr:ABC transporter ATP-binding protein [Oscillospiraceae bacterium]